MQIEENIDKISSLFGQTSAVNMYYVTLYVTKGQEEAIQSLYKEKGWTYLKAAAPILSAMAPIVLPKWVGFLPNQGQTPVPESSISTVTSGDMGLPVAGQSQTVKTDQVDLSKFIDNIVDENKSEKISEEADDGEETDTYMPTMEENASKTVIIKKEPTSQEPSQGCDQSDQNDLYKCGTCHIYIKEENDQVAHGLLDCYKLMEEAKVELGYKCLKCGYVFMNSYNYIWHFLNQTCETRACNRCGVDDNDCEMYEKHQNALCSIVLYKTEKVEGKYYCKSCKTSFEDPKIYMRHALMMFCRGNTLTCDFCGKSYERRRRACYNMHLRTHLNDRPHVCELCGKAYIDKKSLKNHIRKHTGEKPIKCRYENCNLFFQTAAHRNGHEMSKHMDIPRSLVCHVCGATFKYRGAMNLHVRVVHSEERNFSCEICDGKFKTANALKNHMTSHKTERDHVCEVCGKDFKTSQCLKSHMSRHTNGRTHQCGTCGKAFFSSQYLKLHERTHTGDKPYICKLCEYRCAVRANMRKHLKGVHGSEDPNMFVEENVD